MSKDEIPPVTTIEVLSDASFCRDTLETLRDVGADLRVIDITQAATNEALERTGSIIRCNFDLLKDPSPKR